MSAERRLGKVPIWFSADPLGGVLRTNLEDGHGPWFEKLIDEYDPGTQVKKEWRQTRYGPVLVVRDEWKPRAQRDGQKLLHSKVPGTAESYVVNALDAKTLGSCIWGIGQNYVDHVGVIGFNSGRNAFAGDGFKKMVQDYNRMVWQKLGVAEVSTFWAKIQFQDGVILRINDVRFDKESDGFRVDARSGPLKRACEIGYGCVLLTRALEGEGRIAAGKHMWGEIRVGKRERYLVAIENTEKGDYVVTTKVGDKVELIERDLGLETGALAEIAGRDVRDGELVEMVAEKVGISTRAMREKLRNVVVSIADDVDSIGPKDVYWKYGVRKGVVTRRHTKNGKVVETWRATALELVYFHELVQKLDVEPAQIREMFDLKGLPKKPEIWKKLNLNMDDPNDVQLVDIHRGVFGMFGFAVTEEDRKVERAMRAVLKASK